MECPGAYVEGMRSAFRPRRDFDGLEARRKHAARLFAEGRENQATVARRLGVSRESVRRWYDAWRAEGVAGLRKAGRAGRKPRLDSQQVALLDEALVEGAISHGYATDLWTLPRVARVIAEITGIRYHPGHVWRILRAMNWSLQRPARRARERDEQAIFRWVKEEWPRVKKTPVDTTPGLSSKTKAGSRKGRLSEGPGRPRARRQS
jgi:transposase